MNCGNHEPTALAAAFSRREGFPRAEIVAGGESTSSSTTMVAIVIAVLAVGRVEAVEEVGLSRKKVEWKEVVWLMDEEKGES